MQLNGFVDPRSHQFAGLSFTVAFCALGCGSYSSNSSAPGVPAAYSDFASALAQAHCSSIDGCCARAGYDTSTCEVSAKAQLGKKIVAISADPYIAYDPAAGARLVDAVKAVNAACTDQALRDSMNISWSDVFHGTVELGRSCRTQEDCVQPDAGYVSCTAVGGGGTGPTGEGFAAVCTLDPGRMFLPPYPPHASLGQPCGATCTATGYGTSRCGGTAASLSGAPAACWADDGVYCDGATCAAVARIGQACSYGDFCEPAGHCENDTCVADTATGPCTTGEECVSTSYCDGTAQVCTPKKTNGATCDSDGECAGGQCEQGLCRDWSVATTYACAGKSLPFQEIFWGLSR